MSSAKEIKDLKATVDTLETKVTELTATVTDLSSNLEKLAKNLHAQFEVILAKYFPNGPVDFPNLESRIETIDGAVFKHTDRLSTISETLIRHQGHISDTRGILATAAHFNTPPLSDALIGLTEVLRDNHKISSALHVTTTRIHESTVNRIVPPEDDSFGSVMIASMQHSTYKKNGGTISFSELLHQAPDIITLLTKRAESRNISYVFPPKNSLNDDDFIGHLLDTVYHPNGFNISGFITLLEMKPFVGFFSIKKASAYAMHVHAIVTILGSRLPSHQIDQYWQAVVLGVKEDTNFQHSLTTQSPNKYENFWSTIDDRSRIFSESDSKTGYREMNSTNGFSPNRSQYQSNAFSSPNPRNSVSPANSYSRLKVNQVQVLESRDHDRLERRDQDNLTSVACSKCWRHGHRPENCQIDFCQRCYSHNVPFMHDGDRCFLRFADDDHENSD